MSALENNVKDSWNTQKDVCELDTWTQLFELVEKKQWFNNGSSFFISEWVRSDIDSLLSIYWLKK